VGQSDTHSFTGSSSSTNPHAFVWDETNGLIDLNAMIDADTGQTIGKNGITLTSAVAINDLGQIAANGGYRGEFLSVPHAFLLTPKPLSGDGKNLGLAPSDFPPIEAHRQTSGGAVNVATGNVILVETDYVGGASTGLVLRRYYNSQDRSATIFGAKWRSTYDRTIGTPVNNVVQATRADGRVELFTLDHDVWKGDPDETDTLTKLTDTSGNPTGWQLVTADDTTESYGTDGRLKEIKTRAGLKTTLSYDGQGYLTTVTGPFGHTLTFAYDSYGFISTITAPDGKVYRYGMNGLYRKGQLLFSTYPDQTIKTYLYGSANFPGALTEKTVSGRNSNLGTNGTLSHFTYAYDTSGRVLIFDNVNFKVNL